MVSAFAQTWLKKRGEMGVTAPVNGMGTECVDFVPVLLDSIAVVGVCFHISMGKQPCTLQIKIFVFFCLLILISFGDYLFQCERWRNLSLSLSSSDCFLSYVQNIKVSVLSPVVYNLSWWRRSIKP